MQLSFKDSHSLFEITQLLAECPAGCEPEFDAVYEELEREFAELRFTVNQN